MHCLHFPYSVYKNSQNFAAKALVPVLTGPEYLGFEFEGEIPTSNGGSGSCMLVSPAIIFHGAYPQENIISSN